MSKIKFILLIPAGVIVVIVLVVVVSNVLKQNGSDSNANNQSSASTSGPCQEGNVDLEGYTDKGKRLKNCFVEYPGEPTREDKSYYIIEDICGQFTKEFVEYTSGVKFVKIVEPTISSLYNCSYYLNATGALGGDYIWLNLEYMGVEDQKQGQEILGRTVKTNSEIPMRNYVATQENGSTNSIYLGLSDNKFISINRSSTIAMTEDQIMKFAINLAKEIKNYK